MKLVLHKQDDVGAGSVEIKDNKYVVNLYGTVRGGATVEKAVKSAIQALRERKHSFGYFPVYVVTSSNGDQYVATVGE